jgi:hypothetical protein
VKPAAVSSDFLDMVASATMRRPHATTSYLLLSAHRSHTSVHGCAALSALPNLSLDLSRDVTATY